MDRQGDRTAFGSPPREPEDIATYPGSECFRVRADASVCEVTCLRMPLVSTTMSGLARDRICARRSAGPDGSTKQTEYSPRMAASSMTTASVERGRTTATIGEPWPAKRLTSAAASTAAATSPASSRVALPSDTPDLAVADPVVRQPRMRSARALMPGLPSAQRRTVVGRPEQPAPCAREVRERCRRGQPSPLLPPRAGRKHPRQPTGRALPHRR